MKLFIISVCAAVALIQEATAWKCFGCFRPPKTAETHQYQQPEITDVGKNFIAKYTCKLPDAFDQTTIREDPQMLQISDFLMPGEAEYLIYLAEKNFERSRTTLGVSATRTSHSAYLPKKDLVVDCVRRRAARFTNKPADNIEQLQVVRYTRGQQFSPHCDYFPYPSGGQRIITIFGYLNDIPENMGGGTFFPTLNVRIQPKKNSAAVWWNQKPSGEMDPRTLHCGEKVLGDFTKYGLNIWVNDRKKY